MPGAPHVLTPELIAAIAAALGVGSACHQSVDAQPPTRKYFLQAITNATCDLPIAVIKELKGGFKNYIPLALCTHRACTNATRSTDGIDTEIGWNDRGEIRLKQKAMTAAKDHYITTDDFTEIRENFVRGMRRYLIMGEDIAIGGSRATDCADMFAEFFSVIAARPDYTQDWPSYRGYIIEAYTSWVGRRDDSFGLIFAEPLFHKYKMRNLVPSILEQLRQPAGGGGGPRGRGRGFHIGSAFSSSRGGYQAQTFPSSFRPQQSSATFRCYLCGDAHSHKDHQGNARRLVQNDQGKWVDKLLGNKIVCISFNVAASGCRRASTCTYSHSCSLC